MEIGVYISMGISLLTVICNAFFYFHGIRNNKKQREEDIERETKRKEEERLRYEREKSEREVKEKLIYFYELDRLVTTELKSNFRKAFPSENSLRTLSNVLMERAANKPVRYIFHVANIKKEYFERMKKDILISISSNADASERNIVSIYDFFDFFSYELNNKQSIDIDKIPIENAKEYSIIINFYQKLFEEIDNGLPLPTMIYKG